MPGTPTGSSARRLTVQRWCADDVGSQHRPGHHLAQCQANQARTQRQLDAGCARVEITSELRERRQIHINGKRSKGTECPQDEHRPSSLPDRRGGLRFRLLGCTFRQIHHCNHVFQFGLIARMFILSFIEEHTTPDVLRPAPNLDGQKRRVRHGDGRAYQLRLRRSAAVTSADSQHHC